MHWERVKSSACKFSRSDERVRTFVRVKEGKNAQGRGQSQKKKPHRYSITKHIREKCSSLYLQPAELLSLIAGYLSVNEFSQQELSELWMLKETTKEDKPCEFHTLIILVNTELRKIKDWHTEQVEQKQPFTN